MFLDHLKTVKIDYKATWDERNRIQNQFVLRWKDDKNPGKISIQDVFKKAARSLATVIHQEGMGNAYIPPSGRGRSTSSYVRNVDGNVEIIKKFMDRRHNGKNHINGKDDKIGTDGRNGNRFLEPPCHFKMSLPASGSFFLKKKKKFQYRHQRLPCTRRMVKTEHLTVTHHRRRFFSSRVTISKVIPSFHVPSQFPWSDIPPPFFDLLVTVLGANCSDPRSGSWFGRMAEQSPLTVPGAVPTEIECCCVCRSTVTTQCLRSGTLAHVFPPLLFSVISYTVVTCLHARLMSRVTVLCPPMKSHR